MSFTAFRHGETHVSPTPFFSSILGPQAKKNTDLKSVFFVLVAGPRIELGSGGSVLLVLSYEHGLSHIPEHLDARGNSSL